jgi:hypothetical protein|tara:strand:+ start:1297 stop:1503 length:207 start_codon:yes stop_codon:yes gene_type:complete
MANPKIVGILSGPYLEDFLLEERWVLDVQMYEDGFINQEEIVFDNFQDASNVVAHFIAQVNTINYEDL